MKSPIRNNKKCNHMSNHCHILICNHENINFLNLNIIKKSFLKKHPKGCFYYFSFFIFSNNSGKLLIVCNVNGLADFTVKFFTFPIKLNVDTTSHQILYVVIHLVHSFLNNVSFIIHTKLVVGLAHGLNTTQRSGLLCLVTT